MMRADASPDAWSPRALDASDTLRKQRPPTRFRRRFDWQFDADR
ncbi:hypothetical protein [Burkholderia sp. SCN-KJ]|nr:hypothetical protein [Burkholderia sp. SCN-KJ]MCR4468354.1 hypothetical protein [Burkholderia sp. SCN-KJ]